MRLTFSFFSRSGLTLTRRYSPAALQTGRFYSRRLTKLVPPYILFSLLYLLLFALSVVAWAIMIRKVLLLRANGRPC